MCQVWCSSIAGIYARLEGVSLPCVYVHCSKYIYIYRSAMRCAKFGVAVL